MLENQEAQEDFAPIEKRKPRIGISLGDFNGIGPEVVLKALKDPRIFKLCTFVVYGSSKVVSKYKKLLSIDTPYFQLSSENNFECSDRKMNIINCWPEEVSVQPGVPTAESGRCSYLALKKGVDDLKSGFIDAIVTAPIHKSNIQSEEFPYPGHTEYFTEQFGKKENLMLLVSEDLRVGVVTAHIPLQEVSSAITTDLLSRKIELMRRTLVHDFAIRKPKIAVLGLNPHAGEEGLLGSEEKNTIEAEILRQKRKGNLVFGPFPADGFFGMMHYKKFDAVLAMYHDQGLIPFKTLAFDSGVNFTAGLPIVRTSPDHGTAFDIAGKNIAHHNAMLQSILLACDVVRNRWNRKLERQLQNKDL